MSGFDVVLADLSGLANTYHRKADTIASLTPRLTPPQAASGDAGLDGIISGVLQMVSTLNTGLAQAVSHHADALIGAHDAYARRDIDNRFLFDDLVPNGG